MYQLLYYGSEDKSHKQEEFETEEAAMDRACELLEQGKIIMYDDRWTVQAYVFSGSFNGDDFLIPVAGSNEISEYCRRKHAPVQFRKSLVG